MKGIILAGGLGTRLSPLTEVINKFLLPVYDKPLIEYSIENLTKAGVTDIAIILGQRSAGQTIDYLKSGSKYGAKFTYLYQEMPLGVANALSYAKDFVGNNSMIVAAADNIMYDDLKEHINVYENFKQTYGSDTNVALITYSVINDLELIKRLAVIEMDLKNFRVSGIVEKPEIPKSHFAFTGIQIYDPSVFNVIDKLQISERNEYEITHVINHYINKESLICSELKKPWMDVGTPEALVEAQKLAYDYGIGED